MSDDWDALIRTIQILSARLRDAEEALVRNEIDKAARIAGAKARSIEEQQQ
jgi:hypothetical protein